MANTIFRSRMIDPALTGAGLAALLACFINPTRMRGI
jgi:hypothetical protein